MFLTPDTIILARLIAEARAIIDGDCCGAFSNELVECPDEQICRECLHGAPA